MALTEILGSALLIGFPSETAQTEGLAPVVYETVVEVNELAVLPDELVIVGLEKGLNEKIKNRPNWPVKSPRI